MKAEDARKLAEKNKETGEYSTALEQIKRTAEMGRDNVFLYNLSRETVKRLKKDGYSVEPGGDFGLMHAYFVSW